MNMSSVTFEVQTAGLATGLTKTQVSSACSLGSGRRGESRALGIPRAARKKRGRKLASELVLWQRNTRLRYVFLRVGTSSSLSSWATPRIKGDRFPTRAGRSIRIHSAKVGFFLDLFSTFLYHIALCALKNNIAFQFLHAGALRVSKRFTRLAYDGTLDRITPEPFCLPGLMWN